MKQAMIFDAYDDYNIRIQYIKAALERNGYQVSIYFADFDHVRKQRYEKLREDVNYIPVQPYQKNLSYARIHSHMKFAEACVKTLNEKNNIDLVYVMVPPNSMVKEFALYKQAHPEVKIWFDVLDMWPESLPVPQSIKTLGAPVWNIWKNLRNKYLKYSDIVTVECSLFHDALKNLDCDFQTIYLCQKERFVPSVNPIDECIHFLYCGSLNHIVDIDMIILFLTKTAQKKKIHVDIIGEGENKETFLHQLQEKKIPYEDHGIVYDDDRKKQIYEKCHFGINVMKDSVFVGLTMKSLDYMSHGLPLINTIKADTWNFIQNENIGFNISEEIMDRIVNEVVLLTDEEYQKIKTNTENVFLQHFDQTVVEEQLDQLLQE